MVVGGVCEVVCNSGAKTARLIKQPKKGFPGEVITVSVQSVKKGADIKAGSIFKAVIVSTKKNFLHKMGRVVRHTVTGIVLVNDELAPLGTRVKIRLNSSLRNKGFSRLLLMSKGVL